MTSSLSTESKRKTEGGGGGTQPGEQRMFHHPALAYCHTVFIIQTVAGSHLHVCVCVEFDIKLTQAHSHPPHWLTALFGTQVGN